MDVERLETRGEFFSKRSASAHGVGVVEEVVVVSKR